MNCPFSVYNSINNHLYMKLNKYVVIKYFSFLVADKMSKVLIS